MTQYSIAVRSLCEFTAKAGDLGVGFTPSPTAQQGIAGHLLMAARRGADYEREVALEGRHESLRIRGRADGYDAALNRLEEFKTHRGALERMPANRRALHWAQVKVYGAMLCAQRGLDELELALVYLDIKTSTETTFRERFTAEALSADYQARCARFLAWAAAELRHRQQRDRYLPTLSFPHREQYAGQRRMTAAVAAAGARAGTVLVDAPTGSGKTLAALFAALTAAPACGHDKIFYLVAKTSGRASALRAVEQLVAARALAAPALRVLELVSKDSACRYPGRACEGSSCPLAQGFYDRLPAARAAALTAPVPAAGGSTILDSEAVARAAEEQRVCPYYLTQELIRWSDLIVADYNYYFDPSAILYALTVQNQWRVVVLVDEAHNLVGRARDMYSATLYPATLESALRRATPGLRPHLLQVQRAWGEAAAAGDSDYFPLEAIPRPLLGALQRLTAALSEHAAASDVPLEPLLLQLHFEALRFSRLADAFGLHSLFDVSRGTGGTELCIRNVDPATFLAPRFAAGSCAALFSATLSPSSYYRRLLGLPENTECLSVPSPYGAEQLRVVVERVSTRYRDRSRSLVPIADLIARQYRAKPGNYLAFFGSFDYLDAVRATFERRHPGIEAWSQARGMDGPARARFLQRFTASSRGIAFAVLGGVFGEGIDLPGTRLIGAFITTLGLPRVGGINAEIERRMELLFGAGYEYTYLYPGLQKVVQAAGRVIRAATDRGVLYLIDDRYTSTRVRALLPPWWRLQCN